MLSDHMWLVVAQLDSRVILYLHWPSQWEQAGLYKASKLHPYLQTLGAVICAGDSFLLL